MTSNAAIFIDKSKCRKDGICIKICPNKIFEPGQSGVPEINSTLSKNCIECGQCVAVCPGDAITVKALPSKNFLPGITSLPDFEAFANLVKSRRSIRTFKDKPVEIDLLQKLFDMARYCPTAKNSQALSWVLVNGRDKVRKIAGQVIDAFRSNKHMAPFVEAYDSGEDPVCRNAPQLALIYGPESYTWGTLDAAIAIANFELGAKASGLGTCWGGFVTTAAAANPEIGKQLGLDASEKIFAAVMIGYPQYQYNKIPPRRPLRLKIV
ncbi:MAG TPA: nitroreductase family protein [Candidatus Rifleibacterium sp.]|nr:nitroreductase family protein [Candidatus Rifleibacterium sp.]HPT46911.1 nitroreductase family protein [Candidatus Rifleibacterium sp.]